MQRRSRQQPGLGMTAAPPRSELRSESPSAESARAMLRRLGIVDGPSAPAPTLRDNGTTTTTAANDVALVECYSADWRVVRRWIATRGAQRFRLGPRGVQRCLERGCSACALCRTVASEPFVRDDGRSAQLSAAALARCGDRNHMCMPFVSVF